MVAGRVALLFPREVIRTIISAPWEKLMGASRPRRDASAGSVSRRSREPGGRVQEKLVRPSHGMRKVEHVDDGARQFIEGVVPRRWKPPVVLDEAEDRALIGESIVDVVLLGEWRYDEEG